MITFDNLISIMIFSYGIVALKEDLWAYKKAITKDFMWYTCHIYDIQFPLETALAIRMFLLITGGWAFLSSYQDIIDIYSFR